MEMVASGTRRKKRAWEEEEEEACSSCRRRARAESNILPLAPLPFSFASSKATSPVTHDLTSTYAVADLSPAFALFFLPSPDFTLQVTAQVIPLRLPMCDPPLALRLCFLRRWLEWRPPLPGHAQEDAIFTATSVPAEGVLDVQVSRSTAAFAAHLHTSAARFLSSNSAIVDVRNLLASAPGRDGAPWASMPIARFTADAAARIHKFVCDRRRAGSLGPDRFVCHLDITAHCA